MSHRIFLFLAILATTSFVIADQWNPFLFFAKGCVGNHGVVASGTNLPPIHSRLHLTNYQRKAVQEILERLAQIKGAAEAYKLLGEWRASLDPHLTAIPNLFVHTSHPKDDIPPLNEFFRGQEEILTMQTAMIEIEERGRTTIAIDEPPSNRHFAEYQKKVKTLRRLAQLPESILVVLEWNVEFLRHHQAEPRLTHWVQIEKLEAWLHPEALP